MSEGKNIKKCIVVIPIYLNKLPYDDEMCVRRCEEILTGEDIVFIAPSKLDTSWYNEEFPKISFKFFDDKYFTGTKAYNHLMLNVNFYKEFLDYDYMLIAQTDACIWGNENRLSEFMNLGYDYIGAPWIPERRIWEWIWDNKQDKSKTIRFRCCKKEGQGVTMGNGGFCLRNIEKAIALINEYKWRKSYFYIKRNEDIFFGLFGISNRCGFKLADVTIGKQFGAEYNLRELVKTGQIPFGVHGWNKDFSNYDEMSNYLKNKGVW